MVCERVGLPNLLRAPARRGAAARGEPVSVRFEHAVSWRLAVRHDHCHVVANGDAERDGHSVRHAHGLPVVWREPDRDALAVNLKQRDAI